jgi:hypothetical protein
MEEFLRGLGATETDPSFARFTRYDGGLSAGLSIHKLDGEVSLIVTVDDEHFTVKLQPTVLVDPGFAWRFDSHEHNSWFRQWHQVMGRAPRCCPPHLPVYGVTEDD